MTANLSHQHKIPAGARLIQEQTYSVEIGSKEIKLIEQHGAVVGGILSMDNWQQIKFFNFFRGNKNE